MKKISSWTLCAAFSTFLLGCSPSESLSTPDFIRMGAPHSDLNADGLRDDIEALLNVTYSPGPDLGAALQFARAIDSAARFDPAQPESARSIATALTHAVNCVYRTFEGRSPGFVAQSVRSLTLDTPERRDAFFAHARSMSGTTTTLPSGDTCV